MRGWLEEPSADVRMMETSADVRTVVEKAEEMSVEVRTAVGKAEGRLRRLVWAAAASVVVVVVEVEGRPKKVVVWLEVGE